MLLRLGLPYISGGDAPFPKIVSVDPNYSSISKGTAEGLLKVQTTGMRIPQEDEEAATGSSSSTTFYMQANPIGIGSRDTFGVLSSNKRLSNGTSSGATEHSSPLLPNGGTDRDLDRHLEDPFILYGGYTPRSNQHEDIATTNYIHVNPRRLSNSEGNVITENGLADDGISEYSDGIMTVPTNEWLEQHDTDSSILLPSTHEGKECEPSVRDVGGWRPYDGNDEWQHLVERGQVPPPSSDLSKQ